MNYHNSWVKWKAWYPVVVVDGPKTLVVFWEEVWRRYIYDSNGQGRWHYALVDND